MCVELMCATNYILMPLLNFPNCLCLGAVLFFFSLYFSNSELNETRSKVTCLFCIQRYHLP